MKQQMPIPRHLIDTICGVNDPFCKHAQIARQIDSGKIRSMTYPLHFRTSFSTDANGALTAMFCPTFSYQYATGTVTGNSASYTTMTSTISSLSPNGVRLVTAGIVIRYIGAPLYASGVLRLRSFASSPSTLAVVDTSLYNCDSYMDIPSSQVKEVVCLFKKTSVPLSSTFMWPGNVQPTSTLTATLDTGYNFIQLTLIGGPASASVIEVEAFYNFEMIFSDENAMALVMTPSPPKNPTVAAASELVSSETKTFVKEGLASVARMVVSKAVYAIGAAIGVRTGNSALASRSAALLVD